MPHAGDWFEGGVREEAEELNQPLLAAAASGLAAGVVAPIAVEGVPAAMSALKPSEVGDGLVLRIYEPAGRRGDFSVTVPQDWQLGDAVNILEEPLDRGPGAALRPFEIRSWKLKRG